MTRSTQKAGDEKPLVSLGTTGKPFMAHHRITTIFKKGDDGGGFCLPVGLFINWDDVIFCRTMEII